MPDDDRGTMPERDQNDTTKPTTDGTEPGRHIDEPSEESRSDTGEGREGSTDSGGKVDHGDGSNDGSGTMQQDTGTQMMNRDGATVRDTECRTMPGGPADGMQHAGNGTMPGEPADGMQHAGC
ncbi:hypothetical protein [Couchioplanes caeruleus]|nr:hypothetical protein [Couchioplanes caeruleus]